MNKYSLFVLKPFLLLDFVGGRKVTGKIFLDPKHILIKIGECHPISFFFAVV